MTGPSETFDAEWLALREPADAAARSRALADRLSRWCADRDTVSVVDFGAGTGSAMRWLAPRLPVRQHWRLIDGDPALLSRTGHSKPAAVAAVQTRVADLRDADLARLMGGADILSASALLDLVSADWIDRLVEACARTKIAAWLTLSVNGQDVWYPPLRGDWMAGRAFARDQARDKGFGPSLGAQAVMHTAQRFRAAGFQVVTDRSDWRLGPEESVLQRALLEGHAAAAMQADPARGRAHENWAHRRLLQIMSGRARVRIGHVDLLALPS